MSADIPAPIINVTTASGRLYEINTDTKQFRRTGSAGSLDLRTGGPLQVGAWIDYVNVYVSAADTVLLTEPDGTYNTSTPIVDGLDVLLAYLDGDATKETT